MNTLKNIFRVLVSNLTSILSGIVLGFIIPKLVSVPDYGYYKIFTLYTSYLGLFHLGIIDGIVLRYGAKNYEELEKERFRSYFIWYCIINFIFTLIIGGCGFAFFRNEYKWILLLIAFDIIAVNITTYFQQISQITQRFKEYSARKIIQSGLNICIIALFYFVIRVFNNSDYKIFVIFTVVVNFILAFWYLKTYRAIIIGERIKLSETKLDILNLSRTGFPLLFANLCSTLIMSLDRQFVSILFRTEEYAIYAFAYSMLSLVTVATSAVSTVLYPFLKRLDISEFKKKYDLFLVAITVAIFFMVSMYYPLCIVIESFLPKYINSIEIFKIIIPGIAVSSAITVIMHNYYKTLGLSTNYFKKSILILLLSGFANGVAYYFFRTMQSISVASVITILVWYIYVNARLTKECKTKTIKNLSFILFAMACFYLASSFLNYYLGFVCYLLALAIITICFYKSELIQFKSMIRK